MLATTLRQFSVPITFGATIALALIVFFAGVWPRFLPIHPGLVFPTALLVFVLILAFVAGNPERSSAPGDIDRNIWTFLGELILWLCAPATLVFQHYYPESAQVFTITVAALYVLAAIGLALYIKVSSGSSFGEIILIPVSAASWLLIVGGNGALGFGFLDAAVPKEVLDTNQLLRVVLFGAGAIWLLFGVGSGLLENYPKFKALLGRRSDSAAKALLLAADDFTAFLQEVITSVLRALVRYLRAIFNARATLISMGISLSVLLWIVVERLSEQFASFAPRYFASHDYDWWIGACFALFMVTVLLSSILDEMIADYSSSFVDIIERARRFVPLFACVAAALFLSSLLATIGFMIVRAAQFASDSSLSPVAGFAASMSLSFLAVVPGLLLVRWAYKLTMSRVSPSRDAVDG